MTELDIVDQKKTNRVIALLSIPVKTPSLNDWVKMHWATRARIAENYKQVVAMLTKPEMVVQRAEKRIVYIDRFGPAYLDQDNFIGGAKPLVDALTAAKLIVDDSPYWVEIDYKQHRVKRHEQGMRVTILEVAE